MNSYVALLRAVNVGGHGKLAMRDLVKLSEDAGLLSVRTYIASGNVVFRSDLQSDEVKGVLERKLREFTGVDVPVMVRTAEQISACCEACPFQNELGNQVAVIFLDHLVDPDALMNVRGQDDEIAVLGDREIYVYYPSGMGRSKLQIKAAANGTARNMNTVRRLVSMANS
ncbi:MAG: DUF1697 domain-containing protein [Boseongicola sp.]|nr:DUF1697 domain-containing protein [Boseongicola sp.]